MKSANHQHSNKNDYSILENLLFVGHTTFFSSARISRNHLLNRLAVRRTKALFLPAFLASAIYGSLHYLVSV